MGCGLGRVVGMSSWRVVLRFDVRLGDHSCSCGMSSFVRAVCGLFVSAERWHNNLE
jgi:hypothetical protein